MRTRLGRSGRAASQPTPHTSLTPPRSRYSAAQVARYLRAGRSSRAASSRRRAATRGTGCTLGATSSHAARSSASASGTSRAAATSTRAGVPASSGRWSPPASASPSAAPTAAASRRFGRRRPPRVANATRGCAPCRNTPTSISTRCFVAYGSSTRASPSAPPPRAERQHRTKLATRAPARARVTGLLYVTYTGWRPAAAQTVELKRLSESAHLMLCNRAPSRAGRPRRRSASTTRS